MLILFNKNKLLKLYHRERKIGANDWIYFSLYSFMIWKGNLFEKDTDYFYMQIYDELQERYILHSKPLISFSRKYLGFGDRPSFNIFDSLPKISKNEVLYIKEYEVLKSNLNSYPNSFKERIIQNYFLYERNKDYKYMYEGIFNSKFVKSLKSVTSINFSEIFEENDISTEEPIIDVKICLD